VAHIEEKQDALSNKIEQVFVEFERQMNASSATINKLLDNRQEKKWKPANIVALVSAFGGFSGLAAVLIIFIK
jgi:3-oxoacyl-[acyl-carrier-protein] synthase III